MTDEFIIGFIAGIMAGVIVCSWFFDTRGMR